MFNDIKLRVYLIIEIILKLKEDEYDFLYNNLMYTNSCIDFI